MRIQVPPAMAYRFTLRFEGVFLHVHSVSENQAITVALPSTDDWPLGRREEDRVDFTPWPT